MTSQENSEKRSSKKSLTPWIISGSAIIGGVLVIALALMYYPTPTHISLEAAVSHAEMTLGTFPTQQILNSLEIETISFWQFSKIELHPSSLHVADPNQYNMETDSFPPTAWQPLTMFGYVRISPKTEGNLVTIQPEDPSGKILGILDPIHVREESNVIFEMDEHDPHTVTIKISGPETRVIFTPTQPFEIIADETNMDGIKDFPFPDERSLTFRPELPEHRSKIEIRGTAQHFILKLKVSSFSGNQMFAQQPITIKTLDLSRQDASGNRVTALVTPGVLRYPDFPDLSAHTISATEYVIIEPKKVMTIKRMTLLTDKPGLMLLLDGTAKHIRSGSAEFPVDHRLSKFDELWNNAKVKLLFGLLKDIKR
jgi:hypothetical protein